MDEKKKTKKIYHVEIDVVDDIERFREETGDKSEHIDFLPNSIMLLNIEDAIKRFGKMPKGVYIANPKVMFPLSNEEIPK